MDIRCPSCQTLYEFNEERLKRGPVNLKCSQCGHIFRVESRQRSTSSARRWMLRRHTSGEMLYFKGLNTLQKWIVERKVTRDDEISKTSKKWKRLGDIGELASFFQVADSIPSMHQTPTRQMPAMIRSDAPAPQRVQTAHVEAPPSQTPAHSPPSAEEDHELDYFDPLAPEPDLDGAEPSASVDWALDAASSDSSAQWAFDGQSEGLPGPALMSSMSGDLAPPSAPQRTHSGPLTIAGTYDDPLEEDVAERSNHFAVAMALLLLIVIAVLVVASIKPSWLGLQSSPPPQITQGTNTPAAPSAGDTTNARPDDEGAQDEEAATDASAKEEEASPGTAVQDQAAANTKERARSAANDSRKPASKADDGKGRRGAGEDQARPTPRGFDGLMDRASAALRSGDGREALRLYSKAQEQRPSSIPALAGKGRAYMSLGLPQGAVKSYEKALSISPNNGLAMSGLADAYRASGQTQQAIALYKRYLDRHPEGPTAERARRVLSSLGAAP